MAILVTGGAGFIGGHLLRHLTDNLDNEIICVDSLTYASSLENIPKNVKLYVTDIADVENCDVIFKKYNPKTIFHLAAESHVDNSILDCSKFINTNINGTVNLLNLSMKYDVEKFIHISTDEVYGSIESGHFTEETNYGPRNPYSASKASSDHFVMAYHNTYGFPAIITNCSNNYGPRQHTEKLIPKTITSILSGKKVSLYGNGKQVRDWIYVQDHCEALFKVYESGKLGQKYNIGGQYEITNIDMIYMILNKMNAEKSMIEHITDRPGHDFRYSTDITKIKNELGWFPKYNIENGLDETISYYKSK